MKNCMLSLVRDAGGKSSRLRLVCEEGSWVLELGPMGYTNREASAIPDRGERHHPTKQDIASLPQVTEDLGYVDIDDPELGEFKRE
jgi:hypothetical protein